MAAQAVRLTITKVSPGTQSGHQNPIPVKDQSVTGALGSATLGVSAPMDRDWEFIIPIQTAAGKKNLTYVLQVIALMLYPSIGNQNTADISPLCPGDGSDRIAAILNGNAI